MTIAILLLCYLLGSIPFGLLLTRAAGLGDVRSIGSGNIGATNVLRTGNKKLAAITLLLDMSKGMLAVWIGNQFLPEYALWTGLCAVIGHIFPIWLGFKGGKGVATAYGVMLAVNFALGAAVLITWFVVFKLTRYSSLASLAGAGFAPFYGFLFASNEIALLALLLGILIVYRHRENIERLMLGEEKKFMTQKKI